MQYQCLVRLPRRNHVQNTVNCYRRGLNTQVIRVVYLLYGIHGKLGLSELHTNCYKDNLGICCL